MDKVLFKERGKKREEGKAGMSPGIRILVQIGFVIVSIFLVFNSIRAFQIANTKLEIFKQAQEEVTDLRLKNIELILQKEKIETDDYTETDIRNRLNYSKSNEVVFVISEESMEESKGTVDNILMPPQKEQTPKEVWEQWVDFFTSTV